MTGALSGDGGVVQASHGTTYIRTSGKWGKILRALAGYEENSAVSFNIQTHRFEGILARLNLENLRGRRVLDAGCGEGAAVTEMQGLGIEAMGVDFALSAEQRQQSHFLQRDIRNTGLPDGHFDVTFSSFSVFHYGETREFQREALRELVRVTRPGGMIFLVQTFTRAKREFLIQAARELGLRLVSHGDRPFVEGVPDALVFERPPLS